MEFEKQFDEIEKDINEIEAYDYSGSTKKIMDKIKKLISQAIEGERECVVKLIEGKREKCEICKAVAINPELESKVKSNLEIRCLCDSLPENNVLDDLLTSIKKNDGR